MAFARYENEQAIVACIAEVQLEKNTDLALLDRTQRETHRYLHDTDEFQRNITSNSLFVDLNVGAF